MKKKNKNAAAVALGKLSAKKRGKEELSAAGRLGGQIGGVARAESLTPTRRSAIAKKAAAARWAKKS